MYLDFFEWMLQGLNYLQLKLWCILILIFHLFLTLNGVIHNLVNFLEPYYMLTSGAPWSGGLICHVNKSHGAKGRGIKSQFFSLLIVYVYWFIRSFNSFLVANDLSTQCDGSVQRHARRDEEEGPAGDTGKDMRKD